MRARLVESATIAALGVAIITSTAQVNHTMGWPRWAVIALGLGFVIAAIAGLNLILGFLHPPLTWLWLLVRRIQISIRPREGVPQQGATSAEEPGGTIAFYQDRYAHEKSGHTIRDEFASGDEIWAAWYAGSFISKQDLLTSPNNLRRLILADPNGVQIAGLASSFGCEVSDLRSDIGNLTRQALANNIEVRWYDGPIVPLVIGCPQSVPRRWVRVEIPIYFSSRRPNLIIREGHYLALTDLMVETYLKMWDAGLKPEDGAPLRMLTASVATNVADLAPPPELVEVQKKLVLQQLLTIRAENEVRLRDTRLDELRPKVGWVESLIESARGRPPFFLQASDLFLANLENLKKPEPSFELCVVLRYSGVHRVIIGQAIGGFLARWGGDKYNHEPLIMFDSNREPPLDGIGPMAGKLRIRQRVSQETASELISILAKGGDVTGRTSGSFNVVTKDLHISVHVDSLFGEVLYRGELFGEDAEFRYTWDG